MRFNSLFLSLFLSAGSVFAGLSPTTNFTTLAVSAGESHSLAVRSDGTVWSWGTNRFGELGFSPAALDHSSFPRQIGTLNNVIGIAAGRFHSLAVLADGRVMAWGQNQSGQLGNGTVQNTSDPVYVSGITTAIAVAAGESHSMALLASGKVVCWGLGTSGQLGNAASLSSTVPVAVDINNVANISSISAGLNHCICVRNDGTLWVWGTYNFSTVYNSNRPQMVQDLTGVTIVKAVAGGNHDVALDTLGRVWTWGINDNRQLGRPDILTSRPGQLTSISNVVVIAAGYDGSAAVDKDGKLYVWGLTSLSGYGNPTWIETAPVLTRISVGSRRSVAQTWDGVVYTWGANGEGESGSGTYSSAIMGGPITISPDFVNLPMQNLFQVPRYAFAPFPHAESMRFVRGDLGLPETASFVMPFSGQKGIPCELTGTNFYCVRNQGPWLGRVKKETRAQFKNFEGNTVKRYPVENPIAVFGEDLGASPLFVGQGYSFAAYAGGMDQTVAASTNMFRILVYRRSDFQAGTNEIQPIATNYVTLPRSAVDGTAWRAFLKNGLSVETNGYGLNTKLTVALDPATGGPLDGLPVGFYLQPGTISSYVRSLCALTHVASAEATNYHFIVEGLGKLAVKTNSLVYFATMGNNTNTWMPTPLYALDFTAVDGRPVVEQTPFFEGELLPPAYLGKTKEEIQGMRVIITNQVDLSDPVYTKIDTSPELRQHPTLDKLVSDLGGDPLRLANFVINEIDLVKALGDSGRDFKSRQEVHPNAIDRGALGTLLQRQGSPIEQCALLIYLLRKAGYPAAYVWPTSSNFKLLDDRISALLGIQVRGAQSYYGAPWLTSRLIVTEHPWVVVKVNNKCYHIVPWLKDRELTEGFNLYDYLPDAYNSGYKWAYQYVCGDPAIVGLDKWNNVPARLFPLFVENCLRTNAPGLSMDDMGFQIRNRPHIVCRWEDLPMPNAYEPSSANIAVFPVISMCPFRGTNIFNTIRVAIYKGTTASGTPILDTGRLRTLDLHNRKFLLFTNTPKSLCLWLQPFRPEGPTNEFAFTNDVALTNSQRLTVGVSSTDFTVHFERIVDAAVTDPLATALIDIRGLHGSVTNDRPYKTWSVAAITLNADGVSREMLQVHSDAYSKLEIEKAANANLTFSTEDLQGTVAYLLGMGYFQRLFESERLNSAWHKRRSAIDYGTGISTLSARVGSSGLEMRGGVDMPMQTAVFAMHPDNEMITTLYPSDDYTWIRIADLSAQEHEVINKTLDQDSAVSTVRLLQLAHARSDSGVVVLDKNNYKSAGGQKIAGWATKISEQDAGMWRAVTNELGSAAGRYSVAIMTAGAVTNETGSYIGSGALIMAPHSGAALISGSLNGGAGAWIPPFQSIPDLNILSYSQSVSPYGNVSYHYNAPANFAADTPVFTAYSALQLNAASGDFFTPGAFVAASQTREIFSLSDISIAPRVAADSGNLGPASFWDSAWTTVADPVNVLSGEFYVDTVDLALPGPFPLELRRNYSSGNLASGNQFGVGWKISLEPYLSLVTNVPDQVLAYAAEMDGSVVAYRLTNGVFKPFPQDNPMLNNHSEAGIGGLANAYNNYITRSGDNPTFYKLYGSDGSIRSYRVRTDFAIHSGSTILERARPYLDTWVDHAGNALSFRFGTNSLENDYGLVNQVSSSSGAFLGMEYDAYGRVVEAFVNDGRRVKYIYDGFGDLTTVTLPDESRVEYEYERVEGTNSGPGFDPNSYYFFVAKDSTNYCMTLTNMATSGAKIVLGATNGGFNQQWRIEDVGGGLSRIISRQTGYVLGVLGASTAQGADLTQTNWSSGDNSVKWGIGSVAGGFYQLTNKNSGRLASVSGNSPKSKVVIEQQSYQNINGQKWQIVYADARRDSLHLLVKEIKPGGRTLQNIYDNKRRVIAQLSTIGQDMKLYTNALFSYAHHYDDTNYPLTSPLTGQTVVKDCLTNTTTYVYVGGLITSITDAKGQVAYQEWWPTNAVAPGYQRSLRRTIDRRGLVNEYEYDTRGNVTNTFSYVTNTVPGFVLDLTGDGVTIVSNRATFTAQNLPSLLIDAVGNRVQYDYDSADPYRPISLVRSAGIIPVGTNSCSYGNVVDIIDDGVNRWTNRAYGVLQQVIRAGGAVTEFTHDGRGFLTTQVLYTATADTDSSDPAVTNWFVHNERGELIESGNSIGWKTTFDYDAMSRPTVREVYGDGGQALSREYTYYNESGEITWVDGAQSNPEDYLWCDYDGAGRRITETRWRSKARMDGTGVESASGRDQFASTFHFFDGLGNETNRVDALGNVTKMSYDALSRLTNQVFYDARGVPLATNSCSYEPGGQVTISHNLLGGTNIDIYNVAGRLVARINADGSTNGWTYYPDGRPKREYLSNGQYWSTVYDDANRLVTRTFSGDALYTESRLFDPRGNLLVFTDAVGGVFTTTYDALDRIKVASGPPGLDEYSEAQSVSYSYDGAGRVLTAVNALGEAETTISDALGRPISTAIYSSDGSLVRTNCTIYSPNNNCVTKISGTGADAIRTVVFNDTFGHSVLEQRFSSPGTAESTLNGYDALGNRLWTRDELGRFVYNDYDGLSRVVTNTLPDGAKTTFTYNAAGAVTTRAMPGGLTWTATYDAANRIKSEKLNGTKRVSQYSYYGAGEAAPGCLKSVTDPRGILHTKSYDNYLRPATTVTSGAVQNLTKEYQFDRLGRLKTVTETGGANTTIVDRTLDDYGQTASEVVTINGSVQRHLSQKWNAAGRRSQLAKGDLVESQSPAEGARGGGEYPPPRDPFAPVFDFQYQADGALIGVNSITYNYANNGLMAGRHDPDSVWAITRDGRGRPVSRTVRNFLWEFGIDGFGERMTWRKDSKLNSYEYFKNTYSPPVEAYVDFDIHSRSFTYNDRGQLTSETIQPEQGRNATLAYKFDFDVPGGLGIRTSRQLSGDYSGFWRIPATGVDDLGQMLLETNSVSQQFIRASGNLFDLDGYSGDDATISVALNEGSPAVADTFFLYSRLWWLDMDVAPGTNKLTASVKNRLAFEIAKTTNTFTLVGQQTNSTAYDDAGNVITRTFVDGRVQRLTWDADGRLVSVILRDGLNNGYDWSARYDGLGRRFRTTHTTITNNLASADPLTLDSWYDPEVEFLEVAVEINGTRFWKEHGPDLNGNYGGQQGMGALNFVFREDHVNIEGFPRAAAFNDIFGNTLDIPWFVSPHTPRRLSGYGPMPGYQPPTLDTKTPLLTATQWKGKRIDPTGFYYMGARHYEPQSGRFLSIDPLGHASSMSLYDYALGDPVNGSDSDGRLTQKSLYNFELDANNGIGRSIERENNFIAGASQFLNMVPGVGGVKMWWELNTGKDAFTGEWNHEDQYSQAFGIVLNFSTILAASLSLAPPAVTLDVGPNLQFQGACNPFYNPRWVQTEFGFVEGLTSRPPSGPQAITAGTVQGSAQTATQLELPFQSGASAAETTPQVLVNQAAGNAARDAIAASRPGSLIEQNFRVTGGLRRVDVLDATTAIESKVGRTSLTPAVRQELARDIKMMRSGQVDAVEWHFSPSPTTGWVGPTGPLRAKLNKFGIPIVEP